MKSQTNENALETHIQNALLRGGYVESLPADFNAEFAIDESKFWSFLETTQPKQLDKLRQRSDWQRLILERIDRLIKKDGILRVLKKGFSIDDARFELMYRRPYSTLNQDAIANFEKNIFSVGRQIHFSRTERGLSLDMVLFLNGLAIATLELKNPWTGQNVWKAIEQYRNDRDPHQPLLQFGRCLVHFALDTEDVYMTTELNGRGTFFLPFNKGHNYGKGNPPNPSGHRTAYLWEDVLQRHTLMNIIEHFSKLVEEEDINTGKTKKTLYFPRYHQLDVVRRLMDDTRENGTGHKYLIQHSAGSGKSNSITWLAYQLVELYDSAGEHNIFDSVIVVTDRRVLDSQLKNNIRQFSEIKNLVGHAYNSQELRTALESGKKIIITTIQKFPFIVDGICDLSDRKFAVILDEAHSSQSGSMADKMNETISAGGGIDSNQDDPEDFQEKILAAMNRRRMGNNASFYAFTATPKNATLEKFGQQAPDGKFNPFHLYSMKQAIEEGFIMDVLANYTTYRSYYEIQKSIEDNPLFTTAKAQRKLRQYVEAEPSTIQVKANIMVEHFIENIWKAKKLKGQAKAMVVTRNIESAIRYFQAIKAAIKEQNVPFKAIVAFTGDKKVDGITHNEQSLNSFSGRDIPNRFKEEGYKFLVVANKFQTGFDEPLLHTMYVDKKLQGVTAVQTLSRLNRANSKYNKTDTFVLDFYNSVEDIKTAFDPFYTATSLSQPTDVNVLHDLQDAMNDTGVYELAEVNRFTKLFFAKTPGEQLSPILDIAANRFNEELEWKHEQKADFKIKAKQFVKIYAQVACLITFDNPDWEKLHWFLKFLIPKLVVKDPEADEIGALLESVDLSTYGLERVKLNHSIGLDASESELDPQNPNPRGTHEDEKTKDPLDTIIQAFNERHFDGWDATPEQQRVKFINIARNVEQHPDYAERVANNPDPQNRKIALKEMIDAAISKERKSELDLYRKYASDEDFRSAFASSIIRILNQNPDSLNQMMFQYGE